MFELVARTMAATSQPAICMSASILAESDFLTLAADAMDTGSAIELKGRRVFLREPVKLRGSSVLRISNGTIAGDGHSLFQIAVNREGLLELEDINLVHSASAARLEKRSLGAAVHAYKGGLALRGCSISSERGFGVWLVQKSSALLSGCELRGLRRSAVVVFDQSSVEIEDTTIADAAPHAICAHR